MSEEAMNELARLFADVPDPRRAQGVRHPLRSVLTLVFLGLLARIRELKVLERWALVHWDQLRDPLGFTRDAPPDATTISRLLARCSVAEFTAAFGRWLRQVALSDASLSASVDGKSSRQGFDAEGHPVQMLTVFVHHWKVVLGQWSVRGDKTNEPGVLKRHLDDLLEAFPMIKLLTGDAIFAQRPLVEALTSKNCAYLFQIKKNQPEILEALQQCLGTAESRPCAAETTEKRGLSKTAASCGLRSTTPTTFATRWASRGHASRCGSIAI
jgi:hypothetical protein